MTLFWFRRDLRLHDNLGLFEALNQNTAVLPIFIFDKKILSELPNNDPRVTFIHQQLTKIQKQLNSIGKSLAVFYDEPEVVFRRLIQKNKITQVYTNHDYEPYAQKRDLAITQLLQQHAIEFRTFKDQVIFEKSEIVKEDGTPYVVYTPYMKKWKEKFKPELIQPYPSENLLHSIATHSYPFLQLENIDFETSTILAMPYALSDDLVTHYEQTRNLPSIAGTSMLSTHLRFGSVSIREIIRFIIENPKETFWNELIWREFFMQILWHFPHTIHKSFRPKYDAIQWSNNEVLFQKWCDGNTGYPFVDAGMRELNATGHMHNRVRMVVASFLCKHLLIDWRWGETYFAQKLLDYEQSSNVGNWQWAAGSGVDAAPYFRIFNPSEQLKKFDPDFIYTRKWVPEFQELTYTLPIVDHKEAREKALKVYKAAVQ
ncbi:cryptochrome/photolyase family protein [Flavobacterium sp. '19STA2R22 D10 B1']|uniref:cryptochrome/photolyase family protein n=1 Tax=Flavobacterium aerium TaxID=3037261 RepID=UPI00278BBDE1|nr:deoxyribodipyrimidine photo-lyase [Flavobacterium sp. '19STA2R22 D10 B1']